MDEIKIVPNRGSQMNFNGRTINKSTQENARITKYSWEDVISKKILSSTTLRNVTKVFIDTLGIIPEKVYIELSKDSSGPSYFIKADYHGEPLLYSRRQTGHPSAGQTVLMSKYIRIVTTHRILAACENKETLLQALRIPVDLAEIMILPNNKATMDKFEMNETETAPVIAPPKPGTKPEKPPRREKLGNPMVQPRPKAKMTEGGEDIVNKITQRFKKLKHA